MRHNSFYACSEAPKHVESKRFYAFDIDLFINRTSLGMVDRVVYDLQAHKLLGPNHKTVGTMRKQDRDFLKFSIRHALHNIGVSDYYVKGLKFDW